MDYNALAAWSGLGASIIALTAILLDGRRSRFALGCDLMLRLTERFDSERFRQARRRAANGLGHGEPAEAEEVFDFLETVGVLLRRGAIDNEVVWCMFSNSLYYYWHAGIGHIGEERRKCPTTWAGFKHAYDSVLATDRKMSGDYALPSVPEERSLRDFLQSEEYLDLPKRNAHPTTQES